MKAVILSGGTGTRISEESLIKPKPMIEIGERPILWHIMKIYSHFGINDFIICLGYKGYIIKEYFFNYYKHMSDLTIDLENDQIEIHNNYAEPWKITLVDTGIGTMTGGRIRKIKQYIKNDPYFCLTYGDGIANINIDTLINFHKKHKKLATLTAVQPTGRFGALKIEGTTVKNFQEKPKGDGSYINGGFFVLSTKAIDYIKESNDTVFEKEPLQNLAKDGELEAYQHNDFWYAMDTLRDKHYLEKLWETQKAPWKIWK